MCFQACIFVYYFDGRSFRLFDIVQRSLYNKNRNRIKYSTIVYDLHKYPFFLTSSFAETVSHFLFFVITGKFFLAAISFSIHLNFTIDTLIENTKVNVSLLHVLYNGIQIKLAYISRGHHQWNEGPNV